MQGMISIEDINAILSYDGLCVDVESMLNDTRHVAYLRFTSSIKGQLGYAYGESAQEAANIIYMRYASKETTSPTREP